jgi:peptidoglycan/LPS O-acetylase OafA/YrhL
MNHINMRLLFAHVPYTNGLPSQLVDSSVWSGQFGVQIFFVISGYLITSTSIRRWNSPDKLVIKDFYTLRFARIAPLMLLLLTVLCILHYSHVTGYVVQQRPAASGERCSPR